MNRERRRLVTAGLLCTAGAAGASARFAPSDGAPGHDEAFAAHLLNRLGFGPRPGDIAQVMRDPQAWIDAQLKPATQDTPPGPATQLREAQFRDGSSIYSVRRYLDLVQSSRAPMNVAPSMQIAPEPPQQQAPADELARFVREHQVGALESRLWRALGSPRQLEEVMVDFWFNHFNVFQGKNFMRVMVGFYEHQAIRPHALGRFRDLLTATAHHPAMLYYLDNWLSVGNEGPGGRGLNENYARELMELHTLGVDGGYTQRDVTQLARMLTGWTLVPPRARYMGGPPPVPAHPMPIPGFWFNERLHDPGEKVWMGQRIGPAGKAEGDRALEQLANHPATARHIAFKLAQYFVSDQPAQALVDELARVFLREDGQIVPVLRSLFASDEFRSPRNFGAKFKTPYHYALSALRAAGVGMPAVPAVAGALAGQGMPVFGCQTPDGYRNTESAWLNPDAMSKRINFASAVASGRIPMAAAAEGPMTERSRAAPENTLASLDSVLANLGPLADVRTRELAQRHRRDEPVAVALVLAGPAMMRR